MLSTTQVRKLLDDPSLTDDQIEVIRDACHALSELMLDAWRQRQLDSDSPFQRSQDEIIRRK
jgi:hypothetical protein